MTQEEKAKAYDEVRNKLRHFMIQGVDPLITRADVQDFFPELKESEDEKIRKSIIELLNEVHFTFKHYDINKMLAWLEKLQIEKLPFEMKTPEESLGIDSDTYSKIVDECVYGEQKPAWSEEDEKTLNDVITNYESGYLPSIDKRDEIVKKLESIKDRVQPHSQWKPSDDQMDALRYVTNFDYGGHKATLVSLYEQLKKL